MTITTGNLLNPSATGLSYAMFPAGAMSQYMDADCSVFSDPSVAAACGGYVPGCGMGFGGNIDAMGSMSDNMTSLQFKFRSNQHVLGSYGEIMQKNLPEMAEALRSGEMGKATMLYDEIYDAIAKNYGEEITTQEQRVKYDQAIKATIARTYQQINGRPLVNDIRENDEGYFYNGFMQMISFNTHHSRTSEEVESYMLGTGIEGYSLKKSEKFAGQVLGCLLTCGLSLLSLPFGHEKPTKVTEAY